MRSVPDPASPDRGADLTAERRPRPYRLAGTTAEHRPRRRLVHARTDPSRAGTADDEPPGPDPPDRGTPANRRRSGHREAMMTTGYHLYQPDPRPDGNGTNGLPTTGDAETVTVAPSRLGGPADAAGVPLSFTWADLTATPGSRVPIIPRWVRDRRQFAATLRAIGGNLAYVAGFHGLRSFKYAGNNFSDAPRALPLLLGRLLTWASAEAGSWQLRQHAANTTDAYTWQSLTRTRSRDARARWWALGLGALLLSCAGCIVTATHAVPAWGWYAL